MQTSFSRRQRVHKPAIESNGGIVAAQNRAAAQAGAAVLAGGGNAVDAAVATGLAAGVLEPWMSGIGGGGIMLVYQAHEDRVRAFDFGMRAPAALDPADYPIVEGEDTDLFGWPLVKEGRNLRGATAVAVPGHVDGLATVLEACGSISWKAALAPATLLAEQGVTFDWFTLLQIAQHTADLDRDPVSREIYLDNGYPPSALNQPRSLPNPRLLATLRRLAAAGPRDFYEGEIARGLVADLRAAGGCHSAEDLAGYRTVEVEPLEVAHGDCRLSVLPELNGGPTLARAIHRLEGEPFAALPDAKFFLSCAEALREAFGHRLLHLGDEDGHRGPSCTTHLSVVDREGNMVALTQTLLSVFGSKVTLPTSGVLMNNGINWFDPRPGRPNSLAPGKRPLSNYVPVIGHGGGRRFAIGASGGRKIIPAMTQLSLMLGVCGMELETALCHPRIDVSDPDRVAYDPRLSPDIVANLERVHSAEPAHCGVAPNNYGIVSAVLRENGRNQGAVDPCHPWAEAVAEEEAESP